MGVLPVDLAELMHNKFVALYMCLSVWYSEYTVYSETFVAVAIVYVYFDCYCRYLTPYDEI